MSTIIGCVPERHLWLGQAARFRGGVLHRQSRAPGREIEELEVLDRYHKDATVGACLEASTFADRSALPPRYSL